MLKELIKLAHRLDKLGQYDLASELDAICREAASWIDKSLEDTHEEDMGEPVPDEILKPIFPGKKDERDPDELSEEDLREDYKTDHGDEVHSPDLNIDEDRLVELLEDMQRTEEE